MKKIYYYLISLLSVFCLGCKKDYVPGSGGELVFTFDDNYVTEWYSLLPVFDKYDAKMTLFISRPHTVSDSEFDMLREMQDQGHEIACHTMNHKKASEYINDHSLQEWFDNEVDSCTKILESEGFVIKSFAYPYGSYTPGTEALLYHKFEKVRKANYNYKYSNSLAVYDEIYHTNEETLIDAMGIDRTFNITLQSIDEGLKRASAEGTRITLYAHAIDPVVEWGINAEDVEWILAKAKEYNLKITTISNN